MDFFLKYLFTLVYCGPREGTLFISCRDLALLERLFFPDLASSHTKYKPTSLLAKFVLLLLDVALLLSLSLLSTDSLGI